LYWRREEERRESDRVDLTRRGEEKRERTNMLVREKLDVTIELIL